MSRASELFVKARAALLVGAPFWGVLSLRLAPVEDPTISTMQTDGVSIRFAMTGNQIGKGYGLAGGLIMQPSPIDHPDSAGELYWGGVAGTQWWISPKNNIAGVMMAQRQMSFIHPFAFEFKRQAYEAVKQRR